MRFRLELVDEFGRYVPITDDDPEKFAIVCPTCGALVVQGDTTHIEWHIRAADRV